MIVMIAAAAENNALGKNNDLVWHLPDDFKRFKAMTSGHYIVMGRKTFESFIKPLPNRTHIIVSRQLDYRPKNADENCFVVQNLEQAFAICPKKETVFVIGGAQIYAIAMPFVDQIELTRVHATVDADAFFPEIDLNVWTLVDQEFHPKDDRHAFDFSYQTFVRK